MLLGFHQNLPGHSTRACAVASGLNPMAESYRHFPRDPDISAQWIDGCGRLDKVNADTARICGRHFRQEDFQRDLRDLDLPQVRRLRQNVVPVCHLASDSKTPDDCRDLQLTDQHYNDVSLVREILSNSDISDDPLIGHPSTAKHL